MRVSRGGGGGACPFLSHLEFENKGLHQENLA